ncbi:MAG: winged helix-turn-helix transcriptional regulator [Candidatus Heimdallarchaeota archaeon]|nr:winged helix-turn-helix transcriptional regulator [Candidatus Heimdallarchaeota archaeon]
MSDKTNETLTQQEIEYLSRFATYMERSGLSATAGSIVGWLLICHPEPYQSFSQMQDTLDIPKSTLSVTLKQLLAIGFIEKFRIHGVKGDQYRYNYNLINESAEKRAEGLEPLIEFYREAAEFNEESERKEKLNEMVEMSRFFQNKYREIYKEWLEYKEKYFK